MADKTKREAAAMGKSIKNVKCGDLVWVKLRSSSCWWPGHMVDESTMPASNNKPKSATTKGKILVRLYGSYEYQYVDPVQSSLEFEHALQKYDGECTSILKESLDKELHRLEFPTSNRKKMKTDGKKGSDLDPIQEIEESLCKSPSQRRFKVMRALGLTAPAGSPFTLEGCISSTSPLD